MENTKLQWHPAFSAALRITLQEEMEFLEMYEEYPLNKKPPQIDILIIKKLKDITLNKTISMDIQNTQYHRIQSSGRLSQCK